MYVGTYFMYTCMTLISALICLISMHDHIVLFVHFDECFPGEWFSIVFVPPLAPEENLWDEWHLFTQVINTGL